MDNNNSKNVSSKKTGKSNASDNTISNKNVTHTENSRSKSTSNKISKSESK